MYTTDTRMESAAKLALAALLSTIAAVHFYWAAGGARGIHLAIPSTPGANSQPVFTPGPGGTAAVGVLLLAGAAVATGHLLPASQATLLRLMAVVFALRAVGERRYVGFFKRVKGTPFAMWDARIFSPLCIGLSLLALAGSGLIGAR